MSNVEAPVAAAVVVPGLEGLAMSRGFLKMLLEGLTAEQMMTRPCAKGNHGMWIMGHIAWTDDSFLQGLGGQASGIPASWNGLFGMKSEPSDDASAYPSRDELMGAMEDRRAALVAWLSGLNEAELIKPIEGDMAQFARTLAQVPSSLAFHEGMHAGQLSMARRAAGLAPMF
ncbi:MAG: DinB family protein [Phycisphaerales bacterium]